MHGSHSFHRVISVGILFNMCKEERMNIMKIKSNKVSIVRAHSQGSFLLVNPSIPTYFSLVVLESL